MRCSAACRATSEPPRAPEHHYAPLARPKALDDPWGADDAQPPAKGRARQSSFRARQSAFRAAPRFVVAKKHCPVRVAWPGPLGSTHRRANRDWHGVAFASGGRAQATYCRCCEGPPCRNLHGIIQTRPLGPRVAEGLLGGRSARDRRGGLHSCTTGPQARDLWLTPWACPNPPPPQAQNHSTPTWLAAARACEGTFPSRACDTQPPGDQRQSPRHWWRSRTRASAQLHARAQPRPIAVASSVSRSSNDNCTPSRSAIRLRGGRAGEGGGSAT